MLTKSAIGKIGEGIAVRHLESKGFHVKRRNFKLKMGEIDIIAVRDGVTHFIEVKSVAREISDDMQKARVDSNKYNPLENIHSRKMKRIARAASAYINTFHVKSWQSDVVTVVFDPQSKVAHCDMIENVLLSLE